MTAWVYLPERRVVRGTARRSGLHRRHLGPGRAVVRTGQGAAECALHLTVAVVLVLVSVAFVGLAIGPRTGAYRTVTMLTGSMAPTYPVGSVLVVRELPVDRLRPGDVMTYRIPVDDRRVVSHRVVSVDRGADGAFVVATKGDANNGPDPWRARIADDTVWTVRAAVPYAGHALLRLREPGLRPVLLYGIPAVLLLWTLHGIWRAPR